MLSRSATVESGASLLLLLLLRCLDEHVKLSSYLQCFEAFSAFSFYCCLSKKIPVHIGMRLGIAVILLWRFYLQEIQYMNMISSQSPC